MAPALSSVEAASARAEGAETVTFHADVAPLLRRHCQECHRPRGGAPFSLLSFEQTRPRAKQIAAVVADGTMPPWHADPRYGSFRNARGLQEAEKSVFLDWVHQGMPEGRAPDRETSESPPFEKGAASDWRIGEPDLVIELPEEVTVPAQGDVAYHNYRVETAFDHDVWITAAEARPSNRRVVHHIIVESYLEGSGLRRAGDDPRTVGSLGGYVPGDLPLVMPEGLGRRIPRGAVIAFQMHYTPTGEVEKDRSQLGLVLADEPPRYESRTGILSNPFLWIPAGSERVEAEASWIFPRDAKLLSMRPHLHLRGRSFEYRAVYPDGESEILLLVPRYDFDWQTTYVLEEPKPMPAGTRLEARASWDNSAANPNNPDPTRDVSWGEQTSDEMMVGFFDYYFLEPAIP